MHDSLTFLARTTQAKEGNLPVFGTFGIIPLPFIPTNLVSYLTTATSLRRSRPNPNLLLHAGLGRHPLHLLYHPRDPPLLWRWPPPSASIFAPTANSRWNSPLPRRSTIRPAMVIRHQLNWITCIRVGWFLKNKVKDFCCEKKRIHQPYELKHLLKRIHQLLKFTVLLHFNYYLKFRSL